MKAIRDSVPTRQLEFLDDFGAWLAKRSKAIKYQGAQLAFQRCDEPRGEPAYVGVQISFPVEARTVSVRLKAWADRWIWLDARRSTKRGWAWSVTLDGRLIASDLAGDLVQQLEATIAASKDRDDLVRGQIERVWV